MFPMSIIYGFDVKALVSVDYILFDSISIKRFSEYTKKSHSLLLELWDFYIELIGFALELRHLYGVNGAFVAFVAILAAATVESLLAVVSGEQAVDDGYLTCGVETSDAVSNTLADIVEVRSLTANHATEDNHGVIASVENHLVCSVNQLEASGNSLDVDVLRQSSVLLQCLNGSVKQSSGYLRIPFCHNNAEAHVACVRNATEVVFR